jgi:hypothetical protein
MAFPASRFSEEETFSEFFWLIPGALLNPDFAVLMPLSPTLRK